MFFTFLNKEKANRLDISALSKFHPQEILYYYYDSSIIIPWEYYWEIKKLAAASKKTGNPCKGWLELLEDDLNVSADLEGLDDSEFIDTIGPYYYLASNTRFYFEKYPQNTVDIVSSENLSTIKTLASIPPLHKEMQEYNKIKKSKRKVNKGQDELLKEIDLGLISLREIERLNKRINYWEKILEQRLSLHNKKGLLPAEPDNLPHKPEKILEPEISDKALAFSRILPRHRKQNNLDSKQYSHDIKVYLIRYREYEKACERYKEALEDWPAYQELVYEKCQMDIKEAEENLDIAWQNRQIYGEFLQKSMVHCAYQDIKTLELFKYYLKTGRANELQDCINIFEEERNWTEIKASQDRIENTIHLLQSNNPDTEFADEHINVFLEHFQGKSRNLARAGV